MAKDRARDTYGAPKLKEKKSSNDKVKKLGKNKDAKLKKEKKEKKAKELAEVLAKDPELVPELSAAASEDDRDAKEPVVQEPAASPKKEKPSEEFIALESEDENTPKRKGKKNKKSVKNGDSNVKVSGKKGKEDKKETNTEAKPLFVLDVKPAKENTTEDQSESDSDSDSSSESEAEAKKKNKKSKEPKSKPTTAEEAEIKKIPGLKHVERRALLLKARQKAKIQKQLGIQPGSKEPNEEVDKQLAAWVKKREAQQEKVEERRQQRNKRKAARRTRKLLERQEKARASQKKAEERKAKKAAKEAAAPK